MLKPIAKLYFKLTGWSIQGKLPDLQKFIIIVAPHTSGWDFPIGIAAKFIINLDGKYLAKKELFNPPFGWIFRKLGGEPVDRQNPKGVVDQVVDSFKKHDTFILALSPEGTRQYVRKWKTGFYHIAVKANVPILPIALDFGNKKVILFTIFHPTENKETDISKLKELFIGIQGKIPERSVY